MTKQYTKEQVHDALTLYGKVKSLYKVVETLGYPSIACLGNWVHKYPGIVAPKKRKKHVRAPFEVKMNAIKRCYQNGETLKSVADEIGYTTMAIVNWHNKYQKEGLVSLMNKKSDTDSIRKPQDIQNTTDIETLKAQMMEMQAEIDILRETINVIKKDPGVNYSSLTNREKTVVIDALRNTYSLSFLCAKLFLSRSSYYYQEMAIHAEDKYSDLRKHITALFHENYDVFGYRKIHMLLKREGKVVSEKVVRRIMKQENLTVKRTKRKKYNSYLGEITPAVPNLVNRVFHANMPNKLWVTDITEFSIKAGKVYLSPIIDWMDGMPVTWTIGTSPNAELVNTC